MSIRWIHDEGRAPAGRLHRLEHRVVRARDIPLTSRLPATVATEHRSTPRVELGPLVLGEKLLVCEPGGALERRLILVGPDALQVWLTPRGLGRRPRFGGRFLLRRRIGGRRRLAGDEGGREFDESDHRYENAK